MTMRTNAFREMGTQWLDELIFRLRAQRILAFLPSGGTVADFGCGYDAAFLRHLLLSGRAARGIAVDLSLDPALASDRLSLVIADLNAPLPIGIGSLDVAVSLAVLEHLDRFDIHLRELHRVLRPGGTLLLTTPSPRARPVLEFLAHDLHLIDEAEIRDHKRYFNKAGLCASVAAAGFLPERIVHKPFLFGMNQLIVATK